MHVALALNPFYSCRDSQYRLYATQANCRRVIEHRSDLNASARDAVARDPRYLLVS